MANAHVHPTINAALTRWRALGHRCEMCEGAIPVGRVVVLGGGTYHPGCSITAAAGIAAEVEEGDDSYTAKVASEASAILADAARVLAAKCGGRA